jgi:signal transduction histidine kinase
MHLRQERVMLQAPGKAKVTVKMVSDMLADATELDLRDVLSEAYATAKRAGVDRRHRLVLTVPRSPVWVNGDFTRLRQVIEDLLDSASKHTEPGGRIRLSLKEASGCAVVQVTHSGIGLTPGMIAKFFGRSRSSSQRAFKGLPSVDTLQNQVRRLPAGERRRLDRVSRAVDLHGGSIEASGKGPRRRAQFTLRLPLATQEG